MSEENKKKHKHIPIRGIVLVVVIIIIAVIFIPWPGKKGGLDSLFQNKEGVVTTITESTLEKVIKESTLYTAEYPYNSYATVKDADGNDEYYVAYKGTVRAGFDVQKVTVSLDEQRSRITIRLPEISVTDINVDSGSLDYIFNNQKYNTETVSGEAYNAAYSDLAKKAAQDQDIIAAATDNAKMIEKELVEPWVNQADPDKQYDIKVLAYGETSGASGTSEEAAVEE